ncbi:MAG TPA: hypothetical protein VMW50_10335 [Dehalococcoidia bacterium]|nr:hypothetical protein [Dehalococcoidia bacterium]
MAKKKEKVSKKEREALKETVIEFKGGLEVDLDKRLPSGRTLREKLEPYLYSLLEQEKKNWETRWSNYDSWEKQYRGFRRKKTYPYDGAANTVHPLTRSCVDTVYVRAEEAIMGRDKVWITEPTRAEDRDFSLQIEEWFDHYEKTKLKLKHKARKTIKESIKFGEGVLVVLWEEERRPYFRYAKESDGDSSKYDLKDSDRKAVKDVHTIYSGPDIFHVDNLDWIMSTDSDNPDTALMCGYRKHYRKQELELKTNQGVFCKESIKKITNPDDMDERKISKAEVMGKEIEQIDENKKMEFWHLWTRFDTNEDGTEDELSLCIHKDGTIVRCIYNPLFSGIRPVVLLTPYDGEGIVEILEKIQVHLDTIQNQRLDRMTMINGPVFLYKTDAFDGGFKFTPGIAKAVEGNPNEVINMLNFPDVYYSTFQEEDRLVASGQMAVGIAPENIGQPTAERPVFKEMFARVQEANKKFKSLTDNLILGFERLGWIILEYFAQYEPSYTYTNKETGEKKTVEFPMQDLYDGIRVKLSASTEINNQDTRREINVMSYHLLSDFLTKNAGIIMAINNPQTPPQVKQWFIETYKIGTEFVSRILKDFDHKDADQLVPQFTDEMEMAAMQPPPPPQMPPGQPGMGQGGQPPQQPMMPQQPPMQPMQ